MGTTDRRDGKGVGGIRPGGSTESRLDELEDRGTQVGHRMGGSPKEDKVLGQQRVWGT